MQKLTVSNISRRLVAAVQGASSGHALFREALMKGTSRITVVETGRSYSWEVEPEDQRGKPLWSHSPMVEKGTGSCMEKVEKGTDTCGASLRREKGTGTCGATPRREKGTGSCGATPRNAAAGRVVQFGIIIAVLAIVALVLGAVSPAFAGTDMCSFYKKNPSDSVAIVDGNDPFVRANLPGSSFGIDMNCEFINFPVSPAWPAGLTPTLNFYTPDKATIYLVAFDNVWYSGNMACANIDHKLWVVNSEEGAFSGACQDIMIPAETIAKESPAATAMIGLPFTYKLTLPSMNFRAGSPSPNDLGAITVVDDLAATGVDLTLVELKAYIKGTTTAVPITQLPDSTGRYLHFSVPDIAAGKQVVVEVTAVLNDTAVNVPGKQFVNTARWSFARWIDLDEDGIQDADEYFNPLPGESGISLPMTIVAPNLVLNKTTPATAINVTDTVPFTIDVQNSGGGDAWNSTVTDRLPAGMCATDPTATLAVKLVEADGATLVKTLAAGTEYSASYSGCQLDLTMTDAAAIAPEQHLVVNYDAQLDPGFTNDGATLTNVAGATRWFSAPGTLPGRREFTRTLSDGTPGILDFQDNQTVTAALHGYYFEKTVRNLTSLADPATVAAPGDKLRYKLRVFNVDQVINTVTLRDTLNLNYFVAGSLGNVRITAAPGYGATWSFNSTTGLLQISGAPTLNVDVRGELVVEFDITLKSGLANGTQVPNQANLSSADPDGAGPKSPIVVNSDDPHLNGVASPDVAGDEDPTVVTISTPGPLTKSNPARTTAAIGERFEYSITVPATPSPVPLYDVQILDTLPPNLRFVGARVVTGGAWTISNRGSGNALILEDSTTTGIDIPANGQAKIAVMVELVNSAPNQGSVTFSNSASYRYNRANGVDSTQLAGGSATTPNMSVAEPLLSAVKTVRYASPAGKAASDPAMVGDVLEYLLTIRNSGTSTAFDSNVVDTLPANVAPVAGSATAAINGVAVTGFVAAPSTPAGSTLVWGRANGDGTLDIPAGQSLTLSYRVTVVDASAQSSFTNSAYVDWTSLDEDFPIDSDNPAPGRERTGAGCPGITLPNDYCAGPATVTVQTSDRSSIAKTVSADSFAESPASSADPVVRVGDTVTYDLRLTLQEYTTRNVAVTDALPAGLALQSFSITGGANFSYTPGAQPAVGATGTLRWEFGDVVNTPNGISTDDVLLIRYVAKVLTDAPTAGVGYAPSILLDNQAKLSYAGGDPALQTRLVSTERIEVRQPQMGAITKVDTGSGRFGTGTQADPYQVNIASDVMKFQLKSCNNGLAPAYGVRITDLLASPFNEGSISAPVVAVGGTVLAAGPGYSYTAPAARGGSMGFALSAPVNPGQCVTVDYGVGFHTDLATQSSWSNEARLPQYSSLPSDGRLYSSTSAAQVWMTNVVKVQPLVKSLISPAEATVGQEVVYRITVPGVPMNAVLSDVVVTDNLHGALEYLGATAVDGAGATVALTDGSTAPGSVKLTIPKIEAGKQVIITLRSRVANNAAANAGVSFANSASYSYAGIPSGSVTGGASAPLTIVEPSLTVAKSVSPTAPPSAGDLLQYTVNITAASGANFSGAFDVAVVDTLGTGLTYVTGSARLRGVAAEPTVAGDGVNTPQTLTWGNATDIAEGEVVPVTYQVRVLPTVVPGQVLTNSVKAQWTGLDGVNAYERNGSGAPSYNDYFTAAATTRLTVSDNNSLTKTIAADSYADAPGASVDKIVRIGDSATYRLTLKLGEGTNRSVKVQDLLPAGMAYQELVGITPTSGSGSFTYTLLSQPAPGATGTLVWDLGTVLNAPSGNNTPFDSLVIEYRAKVLPDSGIPQLPTAPLRNTATLSYQDAAGATVTDPLRLVSSDTLTVRQPVMSPIVKLGNGKANSAATPLNVNVATEKVQFQLKSCNTDGQAPAYGVMISDLLASQFDERSISAPVVTVGGSVLAAGTGYSYTPPAGRGGSMLFLLNAPVAPGACATVDYSVGFHTDFGPNQSWSNRASLDEYWSLPAQSGQKYLPTASSSFHLMNKVEVTPLTKVLVSPLSPAEATIGAEAVYRITVPGVPVSAALDSVVVTDTLNGAFAYLNSAATLNGAALAATPVQTGQTLTWTLGSIPAGQQAVITLTTRVANNASANGGTALANSASYTYTGIPAGAVTRGASEQLIIVEPSVGVAKSVANVTRPGAAPQAGDILRYTVNLAASSGANFSGAFDAALVDTLSLGMAYQAGSATLNGATIANPNVTGDGGSTPQTLICDPAAAGADIDIAEGAKAAISYEVKVLDTVVAGQVLTNSVTARWTGLNGPNSNERTGADGSGGLNDYVASAAAPALTVPVPVPTLLKTVDKPVANPGDRLRYTMTISNPTGIRLSSFSLSDPVSPLFQQESIGNVVIPSGASHSVDAGTLNITGLNLGPNETVTVSFEALLLTSLKSGTVILNQAELRGPWPAPIKSDDDLNALPAANPTLSVIPANGVVYQAETRKPLGGVTLTMQRASTGSALPGSCFVDPAQQNQVTPATGEYKFDLKFDAANCPEGADYLIAVTAAPSGHLAEPSLVIEAASGSATAPYPVPVCPSDAIPATAQCEALVSSTAPTGGATTYYLNLTLDGSRNQIFNNHIPVDPKIEEKIYITKKSPLRKVTRGQLVPYTISYKNTLRSRLPALRIADTLPAGFKYVEGSSRIDGAKAEPAVNGRELTWSGLEFGYNQLHSITLLAVVGGGVAEGEYVNRAQVINSDSGASFSEIATATVRVIPDPTFDSTDIIGKVFDDRNLNGRQDSGEEGLAGVRVVTARGLIASTDQHGRFHITSATVPDEDRGSNFILKLDDRSLPTGYRVTTENPLVQRATRGKTLRFNFGATVHHVVAIDLSSGVFEPGSEKLRGQWSYKVPRLVEELKKSPSVLRLSYLAEVEPESLVKKRLDALKQEIERQWALGGGVAGPRSLGEGGRGYKLTIETEVFWRLGGPPKW